MQILVSVNDEIGTVEVVDLYRAKHWSAAEKPDELLSALRNSHAPLGFVRAGRTEPMWVCAGSEH